MIPRAILMCVLISPGLIDLAESADKNEVQMTTMITRDDVTSAIATWIQDEAREQACSLQESHSDCAGRLWGPGLRVRHVFRSPVLPGAHLITWGYSGLQSFEPLPCMLITEDSRCHDFRKDACVLLSIRGSEGTNTYSRRLLQAAITSLIFGEEDDPLDEVAILSTTDDLERAIRVELETFGGGVSKRVAIQAKIGMKHGVWCPAGPQMSQPSPDDPFADLDIACPRIQLHQDGQLLVLNVFGYSIRPKAVRYRLSEYSFIHTSDGFSRLSESRKSTWHSREELEQWLENRASRR